MIDCRMLIHYPLSEIELLLFRRHCGRYLRSIDITCFLFLVVVAMLLPLLLVHHQQNHLRVYKCKHWYQNQDLRLNCRGIRSALRDLQMKSLCCSDILILHSVRSIEKDMYNMDSSYFKHFRINWLPFCSRLNNDCYVSFFFILFAFILSVSLCFVSAESAFTWNCSRISFCFSSVVMSITMNHSFEYYFCWMLRPLHEHRTNIHTTYRTWNVTLRI